MKWRRLSGGLALLLFSGCHRLTGFGDSAYGAGTMRHAAGLDFAYRMTMVLCALAVVGGSVLLVNTIVQPERYDRGQTFWGAALVALAVVAGVGTHVGFRSLRYCC